MNASERIDQQIASYPDWRGKIMAQLRKIIHEADPDIVEEWKWDTAVFSALTGRDPASGGTHKKMVCAVSAFKDHVKINFFKGASLKDQHKLLNAGLESKQHRAIDFNEGDPVKDAALKYLIREAVGLNMIK